MEEEEEPIYPSQTSTASKEDKYIKFESTMIQHFHNYSTVLIIKIDDHVKSEHMQMIRYELRGKAELLKVKNKNIDSALRKLAHEEKSKWNIEILHQIRNYLKGNIGFVFTNLTEFEELIDLIQSFKFQRKAKIGEIVQKDTYISSGVKYSVGLDNMYRFQNLCIPTLISRGKVEVLGEHLILNVGEKIEKEKAEFFELLDIKPIEYGLNVLVCFEHSHMVWSEKYAKLKSTSLNLNDLVQEATNNIASIGLDLDIPNTASVPHCIFTGLLNICRIEVELQTCDSLQQFTVNELPSEILLSIGTFLTLKELNRFAMGSQSLLALFFNKRLNPKSNNLGFLTDAIEQPLTQSISVVNEESMQFERVQLQIWKPLVCFYFPNFRKRNLNIKNWLHVLRRRVDHIKLYMPTVDLSSASKQSFAVKDYEWNFINQCEWIYKCPLKYESLPSHTTTSRMCNVCNKIVYRVENELQARDHIRNGNCVAFATLNVNNDDDDDYALGSIWWDDE